MHSKGRIDIIGAQTIHVLAICHMHMCNYHEAKELMDLTIEQVEGTHERTGLEHVLLNRGTLSLKMKNYDEALKFIEQALAHFKTKRDSYVSPTAYERMYTVFLFRKALCLFHTKKLDECQHVLDYAKTIYDQDELLTVLFDSIKHLMTIHNKDSARYLEDIAIPYLKADNSGCLLIALDLCKELEAYNKKNKAKTKTTAIAAIIRDIYEDIFFTYDNHD